MSPWVHQSQTLPVGWCGIWFDVEQRFGSPASNCAFALGMADVDEGVVFDFSEHGFVGIEVIMLGGNDDGIDADGLVIVRCIQWWLTLESDDKEFSVPSRRSLESSMRILWERSRASGM